MSSTKHRRVGSSSNGLRRLRSPSFEDHLPADLHLLKLDKPVDDGSLSDRSTPEASYSVNGPATNQSQQPVVNQLDETSHEVPKLRSIHSSFSTPSWATDNQAVFRARCHESVSKIGAGSCGVIFTEDAGDLVLKLAKSDHKGLWNDYMMHSLIGKCFDAYGFDDVKIPACYFFVPKDECEYFDKHPALVKAADSSCTLPTSALVTERIPPLPLATRTLLIDKYCVPWNKDASADSANRGCLVGVYLGCSQGKGEGKSFSLKNFNLHANQLAEVGLDIQAMACKIAGTMALMHWAAKTDAWGVEFVLGSSTTAVPQTFGVDELKKLKPGSYTGPPSRKEEDFFLRSTELWVLDFNQVQPITLDKAGVTQAVDAAIANDPYLPRPFQESLVERHAWTAFVLSYLSASEDIIRQEGYGGEALALPQMFINGLTETEKKRQAPEAAGDREDLDV
ncbi:zinc finger protein-domain-containing protein [Phialemonium atrogriseum]|uniref:Zinc finger protein-domain-containing protein n=1 Tax=Phialemonium atrogriseum TaxID=1093897 RepID=A0AAJ0BRT8_9PEZI|nr:zinc finger protein-domain-containing protein [Phialemonium atrogriseum]KAK1763310.1 zinc finger protein-domain-containing protein [Phialemonium atrogriseum]